MHTVTYRYTPQALEASRAAGNHHWEINSGEYFGEMPLLFSAARCCASYETGEWGCKLLAFPKKAFIEIFSNNRSLLSEVRIKLLRSGCGLDDVLGNNRAKPRFLNFLNAAAVDTTA